MPTVRIPVAAGVNPPGVCLRHGRPARVAVPMVFLSRPPFWMLVLMIVAGRLVYHLVGARVRKQVAVPAWPWCGRCGLTRLARAAPGVVLLGAGLLTAVGVSEAVHGRAALMALAATLTTMIIGLVLIVRSTRAATCGVRVSRDGASLELRNPHERFMAALRQQPAPSYPMPAGWTVPVTAAPSAAWATGPAATAVARATEPAATATGAGWTPPAAAPASNGWTPPSA